MHRKILLSLLTTLLMIATTGCGPDSNGFSQNEESPNSQHSFYLDQYGWSTTTATLRKITRDVQTKFGKKTLKIWVSNDVYGSACTKQTCITPQMIDRLADAFLQPGDDNDIYDWDTAIYGEEWGDAAHAKYTSVIGATDTIDILLTDIDEDNNANGGTIGYFYAKDNYTRNTFSGSNERIMFYIDAIMFANGKGGYAGWDINDPYPQETLSTLAHEFQHMIHFYQKTTLLANGNSSQTWLDEMLAETTEDMVATKIGIPGPRHVDSDDGSAGDPGNDKGRYPLFNKNSRLSLTELHGRDRYGNPIMSLGDYSKVSAFGTFLTRNYGGAKLLHDIMHNSETDYRAVLDAVHQYPTGENKTFNVLLREWGEAVLLSDKTHLPDNLPRYNTGDFIPTYYNDISYEMGSINFFNYTPKPDIKTTLYNETIEPQSNLYYLVKEDIDGSLDLSIDLTQGTEATLVIKNHTGTGVASGSDTNFTSTESGGDLNITVTSGTKTYAQYLANGKHIDLRLELGSMHKDVYLIFTNTDQTEDDSGTRIFNPLEKRNRSLTSPARKQYQAPLDTPQGILQEVHRFNHAAGSYLHATLPSAKDSK